MQRDDLKVFSIECPMTGIASRATATLRETTSGAALVPGFERTRVRPTKIVAAGGGGLRPFAAWSWKWPTFSTTRRSGGANWCDCSSACTCRRPIQPSSTAGNESIWSTSNEASGSTRKRFKPSCFRPASPGDRSTRSKRWLAASAHAYEENVRPLPAVAAALAALTKRGLPLVALCDACQPADVLERRIERLGMGGMFQQVLSSFDLGAAKPAAECYAAALAALEFPAGEAAFDRL